jgi:hypothetical protein
MPNFIEHLRAEIQALERSLEADPRFVKLRELRQVEKLYETDSAVPPEPGSRMLAISHSRATTREPSEETKQVVNAAERFLAGQIEPIRLRDMYHEIVEIRGCRVGGRDPINGLSAILSRSGKFQAHGRSGWTLVKPKEPSQAPKSNGAEPLVQADERIRNVYHHRSEGPDVDASDPSDLMGAA